MAETKATVVKPRLPRKIHKHTHAVGRRKESIARVYLSKGNGQVVVNGRSAEEYFRADSFSKDRFKRVALLPFVVTDTLGKYDVKATVRGGGSTGQLEALRLGIARALLGINSDYRKLLKAEGLLTRDPRMVERKKYGLHKARRGQQFSKR
jgi:small subunit ribosomal protein S9